MDTIQLIERKKALQSKIKYLVDQELDAFRRETGISVRTVTINMMAWVYGGPGVPCVPGMKVRDADVELKL